MTSVTLKLFAEDLIKGHSDIIDLWLALPGMVVFGKAVPLRKLHLVVSELAQESVGDFSAIVQDHLKRQRELSNLVDETIETVDREAALGELIIAYARVIFSGMEREVITPLMYVNVDSVLAWGLGIPQNPKQDDSTLSP